MAISQGDTVTWTNKDSVPHDVVVTSGPVKFRSPMLSEGKSWSYTFSQAGSYSYTCSVHPDMHATLAVKAKAVAPAPVATTPAAVAPTTAHSEASPSATHATPTPTPAATTEPAAPGAAYVATTAEQSGPSLDPLLLLLGLSTAIVVFCLLLMASRPHAANPEGDSDGH